MGDIVAQVGCYTLEAADRYGLAVQAPPAAGRLTRAIARPAQYCRKDVRFAIDHVRVRVAPLRNHADVFGDVGMGGASPLAVHDFVEVVRVLNVGRLQGWPRFIVHPREGEP